MFWEPPDPWSYSYLLGVYLGDGCVWRAARTCGLAISLDSAYPEIIEDVVTSVALTLLPRKVTVSPKKGCASVVVRAYSQRWIEAFPQHGPGKKHLRPIILARWQQDVVERYPEQFLKGLIDSDGCRTINRVHTTLPSGREATYEYPRYFFSNKSDDIRGIFCAACDRLGIRWTQPNARHISVQRRDSVACLDAFAGPKR